MTSILKLWSFLAFWLLLFNACLYAQNVRRDDPPGNIDLFVFNSTQGYRIQDPWLVYGSAGDFNNDGLSDIVLGLTFGSAVIYGKKPGPTSLLRVASYLPPNLGQTINPGSSGSGAGDVNGDGIDDFVISDPNYFINNQTRGAVYVIYGRNGGPQFQNPQQYINGSNGFVIYGVSGITPVGDVNGDGFNDVVVLGNFFNATYNVVIYGRRGGYSSPLYAANLTSEQGFLIAIPNYNDYLPYRSRAGAGDINGDGIDDILITDQYFRYGNKSVGVCYVVYGKQGGYSSTVNFINSSEPVLGFIIVANTSSSLGVRPIVKSAGDFNGDGIDDVIFGDRRNAYVIYGRRGGYASTVTSDNATVVISVIALTPEQGFRIVPAVDEQTFGLGFDDVAGVGDVNGDRVDDIILGQKPVASRSDGGAHVVYGRQGGYSSTLFLANLTSSQGFYIQGRPGGGETGIAVGGAGDMNGDGLQDVIVCSVIIGGSGGDSYVVYGRSSGTPPVGTSTSAGGTSTTSSGGSGCNLQSWMSLLL